MLTQTKKSAQLGFFLQLKDQLNQKHSLYQLADQINWLVFEEAFSKHYSLSSGAPSKPIRLMVSLLILKQIRNLSDESVVEQWAENAYYQYFSGQEDFQPKPPCVATELVEFRKRIGQEGAELIFKESIRINAKDAWDSNLSGDTTVQEKNITYPTDDKLYKKIIKKCRVIAEKEGIILRQNYKQTVKKLSILQRFKRNKGGAGKARKAGKKIKTIASRLVRELERKLPAEHLKLHEKDLHLFKRILEQKREANNKIYSLHEPTTKCYTKGKEHKKYEFGSKASFLVTQSTGVIVGALDFTETLHDSKTLPTALKQYERLLGKEASHVFLDRGYQGPTKINNTTLHIPKIDKHISRASRKGHRQRAAIEPIISHLKYDYRMIRNYLKGVIGNAINVMLAAAAFNFKRVMNLGKMKLAFLQLYFQEIFAKFLLFFSPLKLKTAF